ncbi:MAG: squalene synthase HpnC [Burkholderiales bacterium]|nr:squalene synthase HpnC [Burkholderiales bacterium]
MAVDQHYENFPVASLLVPPTIRPYVVAIYRFARHADDVADEGDADAASRSTALDQLGADVQRLFDGETPNAPTVQGLKQLRDADFYLLGAQPFLDLLSAFRQDVHQGRYATADDLLDYCRRSANPVGRLMLALVGVTDSSALVASDRICTALQLINFWQDAAVDAARGRIYVPLDAFAHYNVTPSTFPQAVIHRELMKAQCDWAQQLMLRGAELLPWLAGRFRLEIALTIAGGLRIIEKIAANDYDVRLRPTLRWYDSPRLLWLAAREGWRHRRRTAHSRTSAP